MVIILAGYFENDDPQRLAEGIKLFAEKEPAYLMLPLRHPSFKWSWIKRYYHIGYDVPKERVIIGKMKKDEGSLNEDLGGTYTEAVLAIRLMEEKQLRTATVVTSAYHIRRARLAFERALGGNALTFCFHAVRKMGTGSNLWWTDGSYLLRVLKEYKKLIGAVFMYRKTEF